jgi:flagellar basal body rod protein FlgC
VNDPTHYPASTLVATLLDQKQNKINYTPENEANKETATITDSTTKYPSSHAVLDALQAKESTANKDTATLVDSTTHYPSSHVLVDELAKKQAKLENQVNIKSINNISLL